MAADRLLFLTLHCLAKKRSSHLGVGNTQSTKPISTEFVSSNWSVPIPKSER